MQLFRDDKAIACPLCCQINLTKGKTAYVDPEEWVAIPRGQWRAKLSQGGWYAIRITTHKAKNTYTYMHRLIMKTPKGYDCHHKNGDGLFDLKDNLQNLTSAEHGQLSAMLRIARKIKPKNS